MEDRRRVFFPSCVQSVKFFLLACFTFLMASACSESLLHAQNRSYVSLNVPKKAKHTEGYQLMIADFPRETGSAKKIVNQVGQIDGVDVFNVINHPEGKPALAILKIKEAASTENVLRNVLCLIPATEYRLGKKIFFDCTLVTLNKK